MGPGQQPYSRYARHYETIGQSRFGEQSAAIVLRMLEQRDYRPRSVLDLACGTGAAAIVLAQCGLAATGLDISRAMLDEAEKNANLRDLNIEWVHADMTAYATERQYDLCTCFYDAVNYLSDLGEFGSFARCAYGALASGGYLAFDINTRRKLEEYWGQMTLIAANDGERFLTYRSWFDEVNGVSPLIITGFERREDGAWDRFDEEHVETAFAIADLTATLQSAGFRSIQVYDWREGDVTEPTPGSEESFRVLFVAEKPAAGEEI